MYCSSCGAKALNDNDNFCTVCGTKTSIKEELRPLVEVPTKNPEEANNDTDDRYKDINYFYAVPKSKFIILSVLTFGLYVLFWFARNWSVIQNQNKKDISPVLRAIFIVFWVTDLARHAFFVAKKNGDSEQHLAPVALGLLYFGFALASRVLPDGWGIVVGLLAFIPLLPIVDAIEFVNKKNEKVRSEYVTGEIVAIILGSVFSSLVLLAYLGEGLL